MTPVVALVGRPNVGKSTLFNRLCGERLAIVDEIPGTTRDAIDTPFTDAEGVRYNIIDTAGIRKKKAVEATVNAMEEHAQGGRDYDQRCFVCHSQCPQDAQLLIDAIEQRFPRLKGRIRLCDIGTIIGSHAGPGTVAVFFYGNERPKMA